MQLRKLIFISLCCMLASNVTLAEDENQPSDKILKRSLDSSDTILENAVKGTGNVIKATRKTVKNVRHSIGKSVNNNE